jgi:hypothetical protein
MRRSGSNDVRFGGSLAFHMARKQHRNLNSINASISPSLITLPSLREACITGRQTALPTPLQLQHGLLRHFVSLRDRGAMSELELPLGSKIVCCSGIKEYVANRL